MKERGMDNVTDNEVTGSGHKKRRRLAGAGLAVGGVAVGAMLAGTLSAGAATTPTPSATSDTTASPGVQENDGVPEAQEHHGHGCALDLSGTVTAVGTSSVTIKTAAGAVTTYTVDSSSDIDKSGEAQLSSLVAGDAVTYSVRSGTTTIDKLHAGDETKNVPAAPAAGSSTSGTTSGA
jgi:hypothetical protein